MVYSRMGVVTNVDLYYNGEEVNYANLSYDEEELKRQSIIKFVNDIFYKIEEETNEAHGVNEFMDKVYKDQNVTK